MPENEKVTVRLPDKHIKMIDDLATASLGVTRSNVVRSIIADYYENEWVESEKHKPLIVATVRLSESVIRKLDAVGSGSRSSTIRDILSAALK